MRPKWKLLTLAGVAGLAFMALGASSWAAEPYSDWITVDRVLVNKLGGVNVSGEVSCEGTYADVMAGLFQAMDDEKEESYPVPAPIAGDKVNIFVNADQYTVSQPAGRRLMIQVEHGSSRMTPCYAQHPYDMNGTAWTDFGVQCRPDGTACRWETDRFAYDRVKYGPLFDYSPDGKFKAGSLNVDAYSYGALVMIYDTVGMTWETHFSPYAVDIFTSQVVRATMYR